MGCMYCQAPFIPGTPHQCGRDYLFSNIKVLNLPSSEDVISKDDYKKEVK